MTIQVALEHPYADEILKRAELENGALAQYSIELRDDLPHHGFAPYPVGAVEAFKLRVDGVDSFLFYNKQDDYFRPTIMTADCVKENPQLIAYITPMADKNRKESEERQQKIEQAARAQQLLDRQRREIEEAKTAEQERQRTVLSKLAAHLNLPISDTLHYTVKHTADRLLELESLQGGKLNLNVLSIPGNVVDITSTTVKNSINQAIYKQRYKHDVEFKALSEESIEISFRDLKGAVLSKGVFGFTGFEESGTLHDEGFADKVSFVIETINVDPEDGVAPEVTEKGRPVLFRDSRFKEAYAALSEIQFIDLRYESLCKGPVVETGSTDLLPILGRNLLETTKQAHRIANEVLPKPNLSKTESTFQLG